MQTSSIPMDAGRKTIIALLIINIGLSLIIVPNLAISKQNNEAITGTLSALLANQQRMLANQYLTTSSNALLVTNQKNALIIAQEQHNLATQQLNQTNRLLKEIYKGDSKADVLAQHVDRLFNAIYNGDSKADRVLKNVTLMFGEIDNVINNHTKSFNLGEKQLAIMLPIIEKLGHFLNTGHRVAYSNATAPK